MTSQSNLSIIVIEDVRELAHAITALLERAGYSVLCAADRDQALRLVRSSFRPCLLLWDPLTLPVSLDLLAESARRGVHVATLPIGVATRVNDSGLDTMVTKRLTSEDAVLSIVRAHCPQQSASPLETTT